MMRNYFFGITYLFSIISRNKDVNCVRRFKNIYLINFFFNIVIIIQTYLIQDKYGVLKYSLPKKKNKK